MRILCEEVLKERLADVVWDEDECKDLSLNISDEIREKVKALEYSRYKIIVQCTVGENKQQGVLIIALPIGPTQTTMQVRHLKMIRCGQMSWYSVATHTKYSVKITQTQNSYSFTHYKAPKHHLCTACKNLKRVRDSAFIEVGELGS